MKEQIEKLYSGGVKFQKRDFLGVIEDFSIAIELNPHNINYYDYCIKAYELINDYESARKKKR